MSNSAKGTSKEGEDAGEPEFEGDLDEADDGTEPAEDEGGALEEDDDDDDEEFEDFEEEQ